MARAAVRCAVLLAWAALPLRAADIPQAQLDAADKKARELVRKLGDPAFAKREAAAHDLVAMGGLSRAALEAARNDPDAEIRERSRRLLPLALEADLMAKLRDFTADKNLAKEYDLPGWKRWKAAVGNDAASRTFFADMLRDNIELMKNLETDPAATAVAQMTRCQELYTQQFGNRVMIINGGVRTTNAMPAPPTLPEFAALLFVSGDPRVDRAIVAGGKVNYSNQIGPLLYQGYIRNFLTTEKGSETFKKVFVDWLDQIAAGIGDVTAPAVRPGINTGTTRISYALTAIQQNDLKEATGFLEKVLLAKNLPLHFNSSAALALGKVGEAKHVKILEPLLTDDRRYNANPVNFGGGSNKPITAEVRDVALGITIHLSGQKPADFGFDGFKNRNMGNMPGTYFFNQFGFENDANRAATFAKWNEVRKKAGQAAIPFEATKEGEKKDAPANGAVPGVMINPIRPVPKQIED